MSLRYALLGMLAYAPASGYDLTRSFEGELGTYAWQAGHTQIYPELARLTRDGLIEVVAEGPRGRKVYDVTDEGRTVLRAWLMEPEDHMVRNTGSLRLFLMSALDPEDTRALLERSLAEDETEIAKLTEAVADMDASTEPGTRPLFGRLAAEYGLRLLRAKVDWAKWALRQL